MQLGMAQCPHQTMLRLDKPGPGFVTLGAFSWGDEVLASASFYFYGDEASAMACEERSRWEAWFAELFS